MSTGGDAGDNFSAAVVISAGSGTGYGDSSDIYDYYKVSVSSGASISVSLTPSTDTDFDLVLYDSGQTTISSSAYSGTTTDTASGTASSSGYVYIKVTRYSGAGTYSMTVEVTGTGNTTQDDMSTGGDAGNTISAATAISAGSGTGSLSSTDSTDVYKVSVSSGQTVSASMTPPTGANFELMLYDTSQVEADSSLNSGSTTETVSGTATASGYFYVYVYWYNTDAYGTYSLTVTTSNTGSSTQNDMSTGGDAGNTISAATAISAGSGNGYIDSSDTADYYKVAVSSGQAVSVSMTPPSGSDFDIRLYDTSQVQVDSSSSGGNTTDSVDGTASASGYFYIYVYQYTGTGTYSMTVTVTGSGTNTSSQNDMGTGGDAGNTISDATTISGGSGTGYIDSSDTADYYKIAVSSGMDFIITMTPPSGADFDLVLYDTNQTSIHTSSYGGTTTDTVGAIATGSGYFYVKVYQYTGSGTYSMDVSVAGGTSTQNDMGTGDDAGDGISSATLIRSGSGNGYIDSSDTADWYKISVSSGQTVTVSMTPPSGADFDLILDDTGQSALGSSSLGGTQTDTVTGTATASGYFYIDVYRYSGSGIYSLTVTESGSNTQDDMSSGADAGGSLDTATAISAGTGSGYVDSSDTADYYKVSVSSGQTIQASLTPPTGSDFDLYLYDTNQTQVDSSSYGGSQTDTVDGTASASGYFYIYVYRYSGQGIYSLTVTTTGGTATQNDMGTGTDAGGSLSAATTISAGSGIGYVGSTDTYDYYKVSVSSGQTIQASLTPPSGADFDIVLYDTNQTWTDSSSYGGSQTDTVEGTATSSGYFYIEVDQFSGSGIYSLTITVTGGTSQNDMSSGADAGGSLDTATAISAGTGSGYIDSSDTADYYKVSVSSGQTVMASLTPPSGADFDIKLYDTSQTQVDSSSLGGSQTDSGDGTATSSGYFYVTVYRYSGEGIYTLTITVTGGTSQNDMSSGTDAGGSLDTATAISAGTGSGYVDSSDTADYYKVSVSSGQTIQASLTPPTGSDFDLYLYDTNQTQVDSSSYGGSQTDTVDGTASASGYFYIYVYRYSGQGIYSLTVNVTGGTSQNDMSSGTDAGGSLNTATAISAGTGSGYVDSSDTADYYKVSVSSGQTVMASLTPPSGADFDIKLYDTSQTQVDSSSLGGSQTDSVEGTASESGYFYVTVYRYSGEGIYTLTITTTGGTATQDDMNTGTDAGSSQTNATAVQAGAGIGYIDSSDTADYYKVPVSSGQTVSVSMTPPSGADFDLELYDTDGSYLDSSAYGGSQTDEVTGVASSSGYVYVEVYQYRGTGIYSLTITVTGGSSQDDMGSGMDAGDGLSSATEIQASSGTGYLGSTDTYDYYKVSVSSGQTVSVSLTPPSGSDFDIALYDTDQSSVDSSTLGGSQTDSVEGTASESGYFYFEIYRYAGSGIYSLTVTESGTTASSQNDMGANTDAGGSASEALTISTGSGTGYVDSTDTADYYKIAVSEGSTITATLTPPSGSDFDLYLYDSDETQVDYSVYGLNQTDNVSYDVTSAGDYYVRVFCYSGSGTYTLDVSTTTPGSVVESAHPYANNFDHTWTITHQGAGRMRAHFSQIDLESGWDYVYIYDENNNFIESYTGSYRDQNTSWVNGSTMYVRLTADESNTSYGFTIDDVDTETAATTVTSTGKYAVIVGINDYQYINGLTYAVNDAQDWKNYLVGKGYVISAFLTDSQATEANVRSAIRNAAAQAGSSGTLLIALSGHGTDQSPGDSNAFCAYDTGRSSNQGYITGSELQSDLSSYSGKAFIFFDSCHSGGMDAAVTQAGTNETNRYMTTTSHSAGYGWDVSSVGNGFWTYWYLERGLVGQGYTTAEDAFSWASTNGVPWATSNVGGFNSTNDSPEAFDGNTSSSFNL